MYQSSKLEVFYVRDPSVNWFTRSRVCQNRLDLTWRCKLLIFGCELRDLQGLFDLYVGRIHIVFRSYVRGTDRQLPSLQPGRNNANRTYNRVAVRIQRFLRRCFRLRRLCSSEPIIEVLLLGYFGLLIHAQRALNDVIYGHIIRTAQKTLFLHPMLLEIVKGVLPDGLVSPDFGSIKRLVRLFRGRLLPIIFLTRMLGANCRGAQNQFFSLS